MFVFGKPEVKQSLEEGPNSSVEESDQETLMKVTAFKLIVCTVGLQSSYLTWGILQERIMTQKYTEILEDGTLLEVKFDNSQFLVFMNRLLALVVAGVYILIAKQPQHTAPLYKYSYSSFSNIMSSWCQYEALKFISFPTQVLCKASKMIPVMIMGKAVSGKTYPYSEYFIAVCLSFGTTLFLMSHNSGHDQSARPTTLVGLFILFGYMVFDSFTSNWQSELFKQHGMSSVQMMFGTNLFSSLFTLCSLLQTGGLLSSAAFTMRHPAFLSHIFILSSTSAFGQLFIFYTINSFGPVVFVIIMTVRLILSIVLSCIIYQHSLALQAMIGIVIVFGAVALRIYFRYQARKEAARN